MEPKKSISSWTTTSVWSCLYPLFQNQCPHFLLSSVLWKLSQPSGQDQQNGKQTYCRLPSQLISRILPVIFLWTPKGFISPESLLDFFPKPVYSTMVTEKFQIYSAYCKYIFKSKNQICSVLLISQSKTLPNILTIIPQADRNCPFLPNSVSWRYLFLSRKGGDDDGV